MKNHILKCIEFEQLYIEFEKFIQIKGYGNGKPVNYHNNIREFFLFIETKGIFNVQSITAAHVIAYYEYLRVRPNCRRGGKLSPSMIGKHLYSLRMFFDYLIDCGQIENSPARLPKFYINGYKERNICTVSEIKRLYNCCLTKREIALLSIAYGCGLRRNEIYNLNTNDIVLSKRLLIVRAGKNNKSRIIPLTNKTLSDLRNYITSERDLYLDESSNTLNQALFLNNKGRRMRGEMLNTYLKTILQRTENIRLIKKSITLHCLRHSIATHLSSKGANIEFIQQFLGHSEIDTAFLYSKKRKSSYAK
jgi:integrase/recombinase XerD